MKQNQSNGQLVQAVNRKWSQSAVKTMLGIGPIKQELIVTHGGKQMAIHDLQNSKKLTVFFNLVCSWITQNYDIDYIFSWSENRVDSIAS